MESYKKGEQANTSASTRLLANERRAPVFYPEACILVHETVESRLTQYDALIREDINGLNELREYDNVTKSGVSTVTYRYLRGRFGFNLRDTTVVNITLDTYYGVSLSKESSLNMLRSSMEGMDTLLKLYKSLGTPPPQIKEGIRHASRAKAIFARGSLLANVGPHFSHYGSGLFISYNKESRMKSNMDVGDVTSRTLFLMSNGPLLDQNLRAWTSDAALFSVDSYHSIYLRHGPLRCNPHTAYLRSLIGVPSILINSFYVFPTKQIP